MKKELKSTSALISLVAAGLMLSACAQVFEPKPIQSPLVNGTFISNTASLSHMTVQAKDSNTVTCAQPQPDAVFDSAESGSFSFSLITTGGNDQAGEEESSSEVEMAGRSPAVLISRELFFRACEFSHNHKLEKEEALAIFNKTLDAVTQVWSTEAARTTVTIGDNISNNSSNSMSENSSTAKLSSTQSRNTSSTGTTDTDSTPSSDTSTSTSDQLF